MQQVGEGEFDGAIVQLFQTRRSIPDAGEVRFHLLVVGVHFAPFGALHPQRLNGADHNAAVVAQVVRPEVGEVGDVERAHPAVKSVVQRLPISMAGIFQGFDCLPADGIGRH